MNRRQRLVQERFLDNEEAVIRELKRLYGQSLNDITQKAKELQGQIDGLQTALDGIEDAAERQRLKSMIQSKVYQKQYQEALKKQIGSILDNMHVEEFKTVSGYLKRCYEDGFMGAMYDISGQGIPLIIPLDQEAMIRAVQLDSKLSSGLYSRLGEDVAKLKRKVTAQISRGVSTGMSFQQIGQQLAGHTNIGYNNAVRIVRTEGHRVQVQSGMDACARAKENGCDVVKQWDATLDARTRDSHARVDGEIRELDEKFSNGLMFPGDPNGGAAEVVNCRCALLQRARWALDADELSALKERAEFFGLDKTGSFAQFRTKYLKAAENVEKSGESGIIEKNRIAIPVQKLTGYALNPRRAPDKAKAFKIALGYDQSNADELLQNIVGHTDESKFVEKGDMGHGMRYEYIMRITGANGKEANVLTAWIEDDGKKRMTSVYVTKKKVTE